MRTKIIDTATSDIFDACTAGRPAMHDDAPSETLDPSAWDVLDDGEVFAAPGTPRPVTDAAHTVSRTRAEMDQLIETIHTRVMSGESLADVVAAL